MISPNSSSKKKDFLDMRTKLFSQINDKLKGEFGNFVINLLGGVVVAIIGTLVAVLGNYASEFAGGQIWIWAAVVIAVLSSILSITTVVLRRRSKSILENVADAPIPEDRSYTLVPTASPLRVYISSSIDLKEEVVSIRDYLRQIPKVEPLIFEDMTFESGSISDINSDTLRQADIFVLVLGERYTPRINKEYAAALRLDKPILVFVKKGVRENTKEMRVFLSQAPLKWSVFLSVEDLGRDLQFSVADILINAYRRVANTTTFSTIYKGERQNKIVEISLIVGSVLFGIFVQGFVTELTSDIIHSFPIIAYTVSGFVGILLIFLGLQRGR